MTLIFSCGTLFRAEMDPTSLQVQIGTSENKVLVYDDILKGDLFIFFVEFQKLKSFSFHCKVAELTRKRRSSRFKQ